MEPNLTADRAAEVGVELAASKRELFAAGDVVTLHLVLSDRSCGIVGADELAAMRRHALLINTSRAGLIDEPALLAALDAPSIGGFPTDVYAEEPLPADSPYFTQAVEDIAAYLAGQPVRVLS